MVAVRADRGDGSCGRVGFRTGASSELLPVALILRTVIGRGVAARTGIVILAVEVVATTSVVVDDLSDRGGVAVNPGVAYRAVLSSLELRLVRQRLAAVVVGSEMVASDVIAVDVVFRFERPRLAL